MRVHKNFIRVFLSLLLVSLIVCAGTMKVSASGWVDKSSSVYETLYGTADIEGTDKPTIAEEDPGVFEKILSALIRGLAVQLNNLLSNQDINLSIDGIVFGRMAPTIGDGGYVKADVTHFGLEENNPWGIIGATVFYALRGIVLVVLPIILLAMLCLELFHNTGKGRARLKELAMHTFFVFGLLFLLPYALDLFIYFRDAMLYGVYQEVNKLAVGIGGGSVGTDIVGTMIAQSKDGRLLSALVLLASVCAGVFFLVDYIRIALLLTVAFGLFPLIAVMSFWDNKKLSSWSNVFFPNLLVPFVDMILVLVPTILRALMHRLFGEGLVNNILCSLIVIIVIWNVVIVRNRIIRLLGFDGIGGSGGIGQMLETLSHMSHGGKKEEKTSEKPDRDKKEEKGGVGTVSMVSENSHSGSGSAVEGVVNTDPHMQEKESEQSSVTNTFMDEQEKGQPQPGDVGVVVSGDGKGAGTNEVVDAEKPLDNDVTSTNVDTTMENNPSAERTEPNKEEKQPNQAQDHLENTSVLRQQDDSVKDKDKGEALKNIAKATLPVVKKGAGAVVRTGAKIGVGTAATFAAGYGGMSTSLGAGIVGAHATDKAGDFLAEKGPKAAKASVRGVYNLSHKMSAKTDEINVQKQMKKQMWNNADAGRKKADEKRALLDLKELMDYDKKNEHEG